MKKSSNLPKLLVLIGPTASGKTSISLDLAKEFNGEIISADSRQFYKKMDIGTAKVKGKWERNGFRRTYMVNDIPHHLIDFMDPVKKFTVAEFRDKAIKYIKLANKNKRLPMLVGGTGLYVSAVIDNYMIPRVAPNKQLRANLDEKSLDELSDLLEQMDPDIMKTIDKKNKRRLIRALEVCIFTGEPFSEQRTKSAPMFNLLIMGVEVPRDILYDRINKRVDKMIDEGLESEVRALVRQKYSWDLPSMQGIGYSQFRPYLKGDQDLEKTVETLKRDTRRLARRQLSWFRRDKRIVWIKDINEASNCVKEFLK